MGMYVLVQDLPCLVFCVLVLYKEWGMDGWMSKAQHLQPFFGSRCFKIGSRPLGLHVSDQASVDAVMLLVITSDSCRLMRLNAPRPHAVLPVPGVLTVISAADWLKDETLCCHSLKGHRSFRELLAPGEPQVSSSFLQLWPQFHHRFPPRIWTIPIKSFCQANLSQMPQELYPEGCVLNLSLHYVSYSCIKKSLSDIFILSSVGWLCDSAADSGKVSLSIKWLFDTSPVLFLLLLLLVLLLVKRERKY